MKKGFTTKGFAPRGFTIIELVVVIAIIGILSGIVVINVNNYIAKARDTARISNVQAIGKALQMYYADHGRFPTAACFFNTSPATGNCGLGTDDCGAITPQSYPELYTELAPYIKIPNDPKYDNSKSSWENIANGAVYLYCGHEIWQCSNWETDADSCFDSSAVAIVAKLENSSGNVDPQWTFYLGGESSITGSYNYVWSNSQWLTPCPPWNGGTPPENCAF